MSKTRDKIKIGIATEEQVNREFIDAWHRTQQGILTKTEEWLYFLEPTTFLQILSDSRLTMLYILRAAGTVSVQALCNMLERKYPHVYQQ